MWFVQYHDVRITIDFRSASQCVNSLATANAPAISMNDAQLIIDYVYLDSEERKRFAQASHEYLIEQLQFTGAESLSGINMKYRLNFNHPSKYLVWVPQLNKYSSASNYVAYSPNADWSAARDRFAKAVWFATRNGLTCTTDNSGATPNTYTVVDGSANLAEIVSPDTDVNAVSYYAGKVNAQMIFSGVNPNGSTQTNSLTASQVLDSIVLIQNDFTMDDVSLDIATLAASIYSGGSGTTSVAGNLTTSTQATAITNFFTDIAYSITDYFNYGNFIDGTDNPVISSKLQLNGSDRFQERDGYYFNYVQPYQHFSNTPADGINVYSFALKPEDHQPSGSCNFSRIDNATLNVTFGVGNTAYPTYVADYLGSSSNSSSLNIYTVNYNVLRVMSGMAGVAYSN
jgi:hypothetical protein